MVAVKLPDIMSGSITFANILSIRVLEWLVQASAYEKQGRATITRLVRGYKRRKSRTPPTK